VRIFEVGEVMSHARSVLESDPLLSDLWVHGEISSLSQPASGHVYFDLRDPASQLKCVMFRTAARHLTARLEVGQSVVAHGAVGLYEARSLFQLYVDLVHPEGVGLAQLQFELLCRRLADEGLFAPERKRALPLHPRRIGVATSPSGAVIHDILRVLTRRYPLVEVVVAPCAVQGEHAPREIVGALRRLNERAASRLAPGEEDLAIDVIILARGGGSADELAVFSDETVARAIFASAIPVVSAIGHETDTTLADLVADLRAATPSVAAELVCPDMEALRFAIGECRRRLGVAAITAIQSQRHELAEVHGRLAWRSPQRLIAQARQAVDELSQRARQQVREQIRVRTGRLEARRLQLGALSPETTLARGYALCYEPTTGALVTRASQVGPGDPIDVRLQSGLLRGEIITAVELESILTAAPDDSRSVGDDQRSPVV
jgi:exodeoxyribonuclease VII large subunit